MAVSAAGRTRADPYAALRLRDFRLYLVGNFLGTVGMEMLTVAVAWELYERTHSALALGGVGLAQVAPVFALTLPAGHVVDRFDRRHVLIAAQLLLAVSAFGLAVVSVTHAAVPLVYALLVGAGVSRAFQSPAKEALSAQLVPPELFGNSATWRSGSWQLAAVLGPATGGAVIGLAHSAAPAFVLAGLGAIVLAACIAPVRPRPHVRSAAGAGAFETLVAGLRFVWRTPLILATITLDMFAVLLGGTTMLLPIFAKDILHVGPAGLGWLLAAPATGAIVTAFALAHRGPLRRAGRALFVAVAAFGLATLGFALSRSFGLSLVLLALVGSFDMVSVVIRSTLLQVLTPDELRGRVAAVNGLFVGTSNELGGFESGVTAAWLGPVGSAVLGGLGAVLVAVVIFGAWPDLRRLGRLEEAG
ncbi:MAG TPA: MFS transporter [Gemmatimonadaceae bacterium]|nr:MFS transporter [Gemmatimonadaceae bacterium]